MAKRAGTFVASLIVACTPQLAAAQSGGPLLALPPVGYPSNTEIARPIDLDADGRLDIAYVYDNCPVEVGVRRNSGARTFDGSLAYFESLGCGPDPVPSFEVHDVTGDGRDDVLFLSPSWQAVVVLVADGVGGLRSPVGFGSSERMGDFAVADFDANGLADVVITEPDANAVAIYAGDGTGRFQFTSFARAGGPDAVAVGDVNADGDADVVVINSGPQTITAFLGDGTGRLVRIGDIAVGGVPRSLAVGDLNGDGRADVVVQTDDMTVAVFLAAADGQFEARRDFISSRLADARADVRSPLIADVDGDDLADIVVNHHRSGSWTPHSFSVLYGDGTGSFTEPESFAGAANDAADLDGDGRLDLLSGVGMITVHWNGQVETNRSPVANAGPDMVVPESEQGEVTLDAWRSVDPDGHAITYQWSNSDGAALGTSRRIKPFGAMQQPGTYVFTLSVDDLHGGRTTDTVSVTIQGESTGGSNPAGPVVWTATVNTTPDGSDIKKTAGCNGCADAGAVSEQDLGDGGWVEFVPTLGGRMYVGLGADGWTSTSHTSLRHAFSFWPDGGWDIREFGQYRTDGRFSQGDVFRLAIEDRQVVYYVNGRVVYRSGISPSIPSQLDTSFLTVGSEIRNAVIDPGAAGGS
jgi:hypothetical protein